MRVFCIFGSISKISHSDMFYNTLYNPFNIFCIWADTVRFFFFFWISDSNIMHMPTYVIVYLFFISCLFSLTSGCGLWTLKTVSYWSNACINGSTGNSRLRWSRIPPKLPTLQQKRRVQLRRSAYGAYLLASSCRHDKTAPRDQPLEHGSP